MPLANYLYSIFLVFALLFRAQAHRECTSCISLEDLLTETYGIELAVDGLYSAIAFHSGTMAYVAYRPGSTEYQVLMQSILNKEVGRSPQRRSTRCLRAEPPPPPSPFDESFLSFLVALFSLPKELWNKHAQQPVVQEPPVTVSPNAQLFKTQLEALPPFANMSAEQRLHVSVSISVPAWLTGTEEACQVIEAAVMTFGRVAKPESPPSASYTALGYELCRISYDAFECTGPGRIMTIEFQSDLTVMSLARTPLLEWSFDPLTFSVSREHDGDALVEWIDSFVDTQNPDMVMMTGPNADVPHLRNAVLRSRAASHLIDQPSIPGHRAVAMGAARVARIGSKAKLMIVRSRRNALKSESKQIESLASTRYRSLQSGPLLGVFTRTRSCEVIPH